MPRSMLKRLFPSAIAATLLAASPSLAQCVPTWQGGNRGDGPDRPHDTVWFDDGTGAALYACDDLGFVARLEGRAWVPVGGQFFSNPATPPTIGGGRVLDLHVFDPDGAGPNPASLYAAGGFRSVGSRVDGTRVTTGPVVRWNGSSWVDAGTGLTGNFISPAFELESFELNGVPVLVVVGDGITVGGGIDVAYLDPATGSWQPLAFITDHEGGTEMAVRSFNGELFVGGTFSQIDNIMSPRLIRYVPGVGWQDVSGGLPDAIRVHDIEVHDDGSGNGPALYVSGHLSDNQPTAGHVTRWNGTGFVNLDPVPGVSSSGVGPYLRSLDLGAGPRLYAFGRLNDFAGPQGVVRWDNPGWSGVGYQHYPEWAMLVKGLNTIDPDGSGPLGLHLVVPDMTESTKVISPAGVVIDELPGHAPSDILGSAIEAMAAFDPDGNGPISSGVLAVGRFLKRAPSVPVFADVTTIHRIGFFDGSAWSEFAGGLRDLAYHSDSLGTVDLAGDSLNAVVTYPVGGVERVVVAGRFTVNGAQPVNSVLMHDGVQWIPLGSGVTRPDIDNGGVIAGQINDMIAFDPDGAGSAAPLLVVAGAFATAGGVSADNIATWDGAAWASLGSGLGAGGVEALAIHDDGSGPALYAAGYFTTAGGAEANGVAKWDGAAWSALGTGINGGVIDIASFDPGGAGPRLYATGQFTSAGGTPAANIARWDGTSWSALGTGLARLNTTFPVVRGNSLAVHDDGTGPALYVGGPFQRAGGLASVGLARWNGDAWSSVEGGLTRTGGSGQPGSGNNVFSASVGGQPRLLVAGGFFFAGGKASVNFASWGCDDPPCRADFNQSGAVTVQDIFDFLAAYFSASPSADINASGSVTVQDIFDYLALYFAGC